MCGLVSIDPVLRQALHGRAVCIARAAPLYAMAAALIRACNALGLHRRSLVPLDLRSRDRAAREALVSPQAERAFTPRYSSMRADLRHVPRTREWPRGHPGPVQPIGLRWPVQANVLVQSARTAGTACRSVTRSAKQPRSAAAAFGHAAGHGGGKRRLEGDRDGDKMNPMPAPSGVRPAPAFEGPR